MKAKHTWLPSRVDPGTELTKYGWTGNSYSTHFSKDRASVFKFPGPFSSQRMHFLQQRCDWQRGLTELKHHGAKSGKGNKHLSSTPVYRKTDARIYCMVFPVIVSTYKGRMCLHSSSAPKLDVAAGRFHVGSCSLLVCAIPEVSPLEQQAALL